MASEYEARIDADANWSLIPDHMHEAITAYVETGRSVGGFLTAVLSNELLQAVERADEENTAALVGWVQFLYNYAPGSCWGSPTAVEDWYANHERRRAERATALREAATRTS